MSSSITGSSPAAPGSRVRLRCLVARPDLNGEFATLISPVADSEGRIVVEPELSGPRDKARLRVKPDNVEAAHALPRTLAALQALVDAACVRGAGTRLRVPSGQFVCVGDGGGADGLTISSAISIVGAGDATVFHFPVTVLRTAAGKLLELTAFVVKGARVLVTGPGLQRVRLNDVTIHAEGVRSDALIFTDMERARGEPPLDHRIVVEHCSVFGGEDGVMVSVSGVEFKSCHIMGAQSRGIFGDNSFTISRSTVHAHGYGLKLRGGCFALGHNDFTPGPWDNMIHWFPLTKKDLEDPRFMPRHSEYGDNYYD